MALPTIGGTEGVRHRCGRSSPAGGNRGGEGHYKTAAIEGASKPGTADPPSIASRSTGQPSGATDGTSVQRGGGCERGKRAVVLLSTRTTRMSLTAPHVKSRGDSYDFASCQWPQGRSIAQAAGDPGGGLFRLTCTALSCLPAYAEKETGWCLQLSWTAEGPSDIASQPAGGAGHALWAGYSTRNTTTAQVARAQYSKRRRAAACSNFATIIYPRISIAKTRSCNTMRS